MGGLDAVALLVDGQAPGHGAGLLGCPIPCSLGNQIRVHAGDRGGALGRVLLAALGELIEAVDPVLAELMVVQILADDDVAHREVQRAVGARTNLKEVLGAGRKPSRTRVDHNHLHAALEHVNQRMAEQAVWVRDERVLADD